MGEMILKIQKRVKLEYRISDKAEVERLIKQFEKLKSQSGKKNNETESIVGIWKDRFPSNKNSVDVAKELRTKAWTRS